MNLVWLAIIFRIERRTHFFAFLSLFFFLFAWKKNQKLMRVLSSIPSASFSNLVCCCWADWRKVRKRQVGRWVRESLSALALLLFRTRKQTTSTLFRIQIKPEPCWSCQTCLGCLPSPLELISRNPLRASRYKPLRSHFGHKNEDRLVEYRVHWGSGGFCLYSVLHSYPLASRFARLSLPDLRSEFFTLLTF